MSAHFRQQEIRFLRVEEKAFDEIQKATESSRDVEPQRSPDLTCTSVVRVNGQMSRPSHGQAVGLSRIELSLELSG